MKFLRPSNKKMLSAFAFALIFAPIVSVYSQEGAEDPIPHVESTPTPCGSWSHGSWSPGTVTWTKNSSGCWVAAISSATETCVWSDPCANTTKTDDVHSVSYSSTSDLKKPDPDDNNTWYFEATFTATSSCDGGDNVVVVTHAYDDCNCGCTCGQ